MARIYEPFWGVWCVWLRYFDVFRKSWPYYLVTTFVEPILYLLSFGLGVGSLVGSFQVQGVEIGYRQFVFSGIIGQTILFQAFFESSYGGFIRMYYQKIFHSMAVTPITLSEVLWGELFWSATKATFAAEVVTLIGVATGDFPWTALLVILPIAFVSAFLFAAMGLAVAAYSKTIEQISYPQYLLVFPMFLFCGVLFPVESLPRSLQWVAWLLPLTSINALLRSFTLGFAFDLRGVPLILAWLIALVFISRRAMIKRLVK